MKFEDLLAKGRELAAAAAKNPEIKLVAGLRKDHDWLIYTWPATPYAALTPALNDRLAKLYEEARTAGAAGTMCRWFGLDIAVLFYVQADPTTATLRAAATRLHEEASRLEALAKLIERRPRGTPAGTPSGGG